MLVLATAVLATLAPTAFGSDRTSSAEELKQELLSLLDRRKARLDALDSPTAADYVGYCRFLAESGYHDMPIYDVLEERSQACKEELTQRFPRHPETLLFTLEQQWSDFDEHFDRALSAGLADWSGDHQQGLFQLAAARLDDEHKAAAYALMLDDQHRSFHTYWKALKYVKDNYPGEVPAKPLAELRSLAMSSYEKNLYFDEFRSVDAQIVESFTAQMKGENNQIGDGMKLTLYAIKNDIESARKLIEESDSVYDIQDSLQSLMLDPPVTLSPEARASLYSLWSGEGWARDPLLNVWYGLSKDSGLAGLPPVRNIATTLAVCIGLFLSPLIIVMPIHYLGLVRQQRYDSFEPIFPGLTLKSFFVAAGGLVVIDVFMAQYLTGANLFAAFVETTYWAEPEDNFADVLVYGTLLQLAVALLVVNTRVFGLMRGTQRASIAKVLGLVFFAVIACLLTARIVNLINPIGVEDVVSNTLAIGEYITQLMREQGLLMTLLIVAVLGPVFEELLCRAIILNSSQRHLGFWSANVLQALVFMSLHLDTALYLYYFTFGIIAGLIYRSTRTLAAPILMHITINCLAVLSLWAVAEFQSDMPEAAADNVVAGSAIESCLQFNGADHYAAFLDCWAASEQGDIRATNRIVGFTFSKYMPADHSTRALQWLLDAEESASGPSYYLIHQIYQSSPAHIDPLLARKYLVKSVDADFPAAQSQLASIKLFVETPSVAGEIDAAIALLEKAIDQDYPPARNQLAWFYSTTSSEAHRNGEKAIELMKPLLPAETMPYGWVDTLACAYAAESEFSSAVELQQLVVDKARQAPNEDELTELLERLALFQEGKSYYSDQY